MDQYGRRPMGNTPEMGSGPRAPAEPARPDPLRPVNAQAARFEDEKRRIMGTCFAKRDESGRLAQSYITHIRVEENAAYQSSPPPPDSNPQYRKPRVIILAVKPSGRVSMHKARENPDGSFQIGKTWGLEELQSIESFNNTLPKTPEEQQKADWAGPMGFLIDMSKPYYWCAKSTKEKDFFIGSLVKVYSKFTGGKVPEMIGFDQKDKDAILSSLRPSTASSARPAANRSDSPLAPRVSSMDHSQGPNQQPSLPLPYRPFAGGDRRPDSSSSSLDSNYPPRGTSASPMLQNAPANGVKTYQPSQSLPPASSPAYGSPSRSRNLTPQLSSRPSQNGLQQSVQPSYPPGGLRSPGVPDFLHLSPQAPESNSQNSSLFSSPTTPAQTASYQLPSERSRNLQQSPPIVSNLNNIPVDVPLSSSTTDRWRPSAVSPDPAPRETTRASYEPTPPRNFDESLTNGSAHKPPERRRPPLADSLSSRPDDAPTAARPRTSASTAGGPSSSAEWPSTPQPPGAFAPETPTPEPSSAFDFANASPSKSQSPAESEAVPAENIDSYPEPRIQEDSLDSVPQYRPGLGPMTGRKLDVANKFRKAANAHRAFVPRAGGAGDRMFGKAKQSNENEPDGITGVVPARSGARNLSQDSTADQPQPQKQEEKNEKRLSPTPLNIPIQQDQTPPIHVVDGDNLDPPPTSADLRTPEFPRQLSQDEMPRPLVVQKPQRTSDRTKPKRKANPFAGALSTLGINHSVAQDSRALVFEDNLTEFGWERNFLQRKKLDMLQTNMRKEVTRIEGGTWLGHSDHKDDRIGAFEKAIDKAIAAVDEMDGLLTLYSVELGTLVDDVAYIEAQSQGLQVQTANQKLLQYELESLVNTVSLDSNQLEPLRVASLGDIQGLEAIEGALSLLYKAIQRIDPASLTRSAALAQSGAAPAQGMRALQERKAQYMSETQSFLLRLKQFVDPTFGSAFKRTQDALRRTSMSSRHHSSPHDEGRKDLWQYNPLLLFVKEVDIVCWKDILKVYQSRAREVYQEEIRGSINEWKKRAKNTLPEEQEALFTTQEKEHEGLATAARKITVKRSATLAKSLRQASLEKRSAMPRSQEANLSAATVFAGVLSDLMPTISAEQNFVTDFFHASGVENLEFVDAVILERPNERLIPDLTSKRAHESDRMMASTVNQAMDAIFASWSIETHNMLEWTVGQGPFQGIGVLACLERARLNLDDTNQEYLLKIVQRQRDFLVHKFEPFISEQINAIENVKIKTNKRRGIMSFTRTFPIFAVTVENMIPHFPDATENPVPDTRRVIDEAYGRIVNTIFKALDSIARDAVVGASSNTSAADPEDKEALNALIMLIENSHHLFSELDPAKNQALLDCRRRAGSSMLMHRDRYVSAVMRRPLGRLLDFLEQVETDRRTAAMATHSRSAFKKILNNYDAKTVRRDVDALKKRVEKHFSGGEGGSEDHASSVGAGQNRLPAEVLEVCEKRWTEVLERTESVCKNIYDGELAVEFSRTDIATAFRR